MNAAIYNSRNSKDLIVVNPKCDNRLHIYNSRNSKDLIVKQECPECKTIYNSRNSKDLIVPVRVNFIVYDLQQ